MTRWPCAVVALFLTPLALSAADPKEPKDPFAAVDAYALKTPASAEESVEALGQYLAKAGKTERDKARAIYRWMTDRIAYDAESFFAGKQPNGKAENVLKTRKGVCDGYANLFKAICDEAGVKCERVVGRSKGPGFEDNPKSDKFNHAWNAVELDGKWLLVDSTWGAGGLKDKEFSKNFNDLYFLIAPEKLIYTHMPTEEKWQLLKKPISDADFVAQPAVPPMLFRLGVTPEKLTKTSGEKNFKEFVKVYDHPGSATTKMLVGPLNGILKAGTTYDFQFTSDKYEAMAFVIDGKFYYFAKEGKIFKGKLSFLKGKVRIVGQVPKEKGGHGILEYVVE